MTLKQIAAEAGVSAMTVSNVINHHDDKVSEETRKRVQAIIDKNHYTPNMSARSLSARNSRIIAILLPIYLPAPEELEKYPLLAGNWTPDKFTPLSDPYVSLMIGLLEGKLKQDGYYVMLRSFRTMEEVLDLQRNWQVDGCVMITPMLDDRQNRALLQQTGCPLVMIDRNYPDVEMLSVVVNDYRGGYLATEVCIRYGHRRIAFISTTDLVPTDAGERVPRSSVIYSRYQGYQAALRDGAVPEDRGLIFSAPNSIEEGKRCADRIMALPEERRPTAIFATSDNLALGILIRLKELGVRIPDEMSIVGYDNIPLADLTSPGLTTVAQEAGEKVEAAVTLLQRAIEDPADRNRTVQIDVRLVERGSVARRKKEK
jgi:LacI family transcriptional regulator